MAQCKYVKDSNGGVHSLLDARLDNSLLYVKEVSHIYSVNANDIVNWNPYTDDYDVDGYTPIGIVGYASNSYAVDVINLRFVDNIYGIQIMNRTNADVSNLPFYYHLLYVKSL